MLVSNPCGPALAGRVRPKGARSALYRGHGQTLGRGCALGGAWTERHMEDRHTASPDSRALPAVTNARLTSSFAVAARPYRPTLATSSPCRSRPSSCVRIDTARYLPHCPPEAAHTRCRTFNAS